MLIDTHCHLDAAEFAGRQPELLKTAQAAGVERLVVPSVMRANFSRVRALCQRYANCAPAYGIHPIYSNATTPQDMAELRDYLEYGDAVAVGEIGLDFFMVRQAHHERDFDQVQQEALFSSQLKLAREFGLPVLLHTRQAMDTVLKHLRHTKVPGGIAHAFNGSRSQAEEFIKLGFKLGFGGTMTYPRATRVRELASTLPLSSIVLETDAPDMAPSFIEHGQPNRPEYLQRYAQLLAELRGVTTNEIAQATTANALAIMPKLNSKSRYN